MEKTVYQPPYRFKNPSNGNVLFTATLDSAQRILALHDSVLTRIPRDIAKYGVCELFFNDRSNCFDMKHINVEAV